MIMTNLNFFAAQEGGMEGVKMRKLVCDKCGVEIDTSYMDKFDIKPSSMIRIYVSKLRGTGGLIESPDDLEYDLCEDCTNQLVTFLKG